MTVHNAVALPTAEDLRTRSESPDDGLILFLGRVEERKGAFDLIDAAALLRGRYRLVICGEGAIDAAAQHARSRGVDGRVSFPGWIDGQGKRELLRRASILVLPSYHEGVPMAVLEAMSWSIPVVATAVGGIPDIVTDGKEGVLVQPGDPAGLAQAIERLMDDPTLRAALGSAGRRKMQLQFSEPVLHEELTDLWECFGPARPQETCREQT
jgi:glycosyltransferase involved in cell wall biosynthesis